MNMRKVTSLTALLSFIVLIVNSVILYIMPFGRVAYWSDWHMWGLNKTEWGDQHIIIGVLFLIAIMLHIYYNWKPITSYLKNKAKELKFFNKEFNIALIVTIVCIIGSYFTLPPFSIVLDFGESIKDAGGVRYGEPPYGHAELSTLKTFARRNGFDLQKSMENLKKAGIIFKDEKQTLLFIARLNRMSPQQIYLAMKPEEKSESDTGPKKLPDSPIAGTGKQSVTQICQAYHLDLTMVMSGLALNSIKGTADMSLKTIAEHNNVGPIDVYDIIKKIADSSQPAISAETAAGAKIESQAPRKGTPSGLGRMTVAEACRKYNLDGPNAMQKLSAKGIVAKPEDKLRELAEKYEMNPIDLYEIMK